MIKKILFLLPALVLAGCDSIGGIGSDNLPQPKDVASFTPQFTPNTVWNTRIGGGTYGYYDTLLTPIDKTRIYSVTEKGEVAAMYRSSGEVIWDKNVKLQITSGPSVDGNMVVFGTLNAKAIAMRASDGAELWHTDLPNQATAAPLLIGDKVIFKTIDGRLVALNKTDGHEIWNYHHGAPAFILRPSSRIKHIGNKLLVGFSDGKVAAFDLRNGHLLWEKTIAYPDGVTMTKRLVDISGDMDTDGEDLYVVTYQGELASVNGNSGEILWHRPLNSYAGLTISQKLVIVVATDGIVTAYNRNNGDLVWTQSELARHELTAPAVQRNTVAVGDKLGSLYWLNLKNGQMIASKEAFADEPIVATPVVDDNILYMVTQKGNVAAISIQQ